MNLYEKTVEAKKPEGTFRQKIGTFAARTALIGAGVAAIFTVTAGTEIATNTGARAQAEGPNGAEQAWCRWPSRYKLCLEVNNLANESVDVATRVADEYDRSLHNGDADAFRHCYWNGRMAETLGPETAQGFGDRHEYNDQQPDYEERMDLYNNAIGRKIGTSGSDIYRDCLNAMLNNELFVPVPFKR